MPRHGTERYTQRRQRPLFSFVDQDKADVSALKQCFIDLQYQLKSISLATVERKPLSVKESIAALEKDIEIKQQTISKYEDKLEAWMKLLPELESRSREMLNATHTSLPSPPTQTASPSKQGTQRASESHQGPLEEQPTGSSEHAAPAPQENDENDENDDDDEDEDMEFVDVS
ncbi:hypothetical protein BC940DRAFT_322524 [Gongronella butleri]|nr:hypothetical protein BC940DRAFT_322524 [Gongronella butleri]